jgi:D-glycerate 3-kinase
MLLAAPSFEVVFDWRLQQEEELRDRAGPNAPGVMDAAAVQRFIRHYERLTRHILADMPARADVLVQLDENRTPLAITRNPAALR